MSEKKVFVFGSFTEHETRSLLEKKPIKATQNQNQKGVGSIQFGSLNLAAEKSSVICNGDVKKGQADGAIKSRPSSSHKEDKSSQSAGSQKKVNASTPSSSHKISGNDAKLPRKHSSGVLEHVGVNGTTGEVSGSKSLNNGVAAKSDPIGLDKLSLSDDESDSFYNSSGSKFQALDGEVLLSDSSSGSIPRENNNRMVPTESLPPIRDFTPRGLINAGNLCFLNATLQALLSCSPFVQLLQGIQLQDIPKADSPTLAAFSEFISELDVPSSLSFRNNVTVVESGRPFTPAMFEEVLRKFTPDVLNNMSGRPRQEDAQEFLSFIMDQMHDELLKLREQSSKVTASKSSVISSASEEDEWETVGPKNKSAVTRTQSFVPSELSDIFGGQLRSVVKAKGNKDSATVQPYLLLHLDIHPEAVRTIEDALHLFSAPEDLEGYRASVTGKAGVVSARKSIKIQKLSKIMILHFAVNPSSSYRFAIVEPKSGFDSGLDSDSEALLYHQDYSPPAPPPPPPHGPSVSCTDDLGGVGFLDTTCKIVADLNLTHDVYIAGKGNFIILPGVRFHCPFPGCSIAINVSGNFSLGSKSTIVAGSLDLAAGNATFENGSAVNTTGLAGDPPPQTSGTSQQIDGSGGGHGGRGAGCLTDTSKLPENVWGGDAYSWSTLQKPASYGSKGQSTSKEVEYGGGGGGKVKMDILQFLEVNGSILADGGYGGAKGGGGSGGSIYIVAYKMTGIGLISACGGSGYGGGGGGRVSVDIFSRHDDPKIFVHGGYSIGCPDNSGAAGTLYDAVPRSLFVSNYNMTTDTYTLLLEFPFPLWTNVYIQDKARATCPLLWSRVQVQGQISLLCGGVLSFGLSQYGTSVFELFAEELLMSDSTIKVYGALRMTVKMFLMWNSELHILGGGGDATVSTSMLEASNLFVLKGSSVIRSNANLEVHGQGFLNLTGPGDSIEAQRLVLSLFYRIYVGPGSILRAPLQNASRDAVTPKLYCERQDCPYELLNPPEDCNVNSSLSFTLQICRVEDILVEGFIKGSVVHFHRAKTVTLQPSGEISASGMGNNKCFLFGFCFDRASYFYISYGLVLGLLPQYKI